jgi:hypothetical protein
MRRRAATGRARRIIFRAEEERTLWPYKSMEPTESGRRMGTGHHAATAAGVGPGKTVAVVGDGAVGLCGVIASKRLGAEQIILLGRIEPGRVFDRTGALDQVSDGYRAMNERGVLKVRDRVLRGANSSKEQGRVSRQAAASRLSQRRRVHWRR